MERKVIDISIPYVSKGEELTKDFKIKFTSRGVIKQYSALMAHFEVIRALKIARKKSGAGIRRYGHGP